MSKSGNSSLSAVQSFVEKVKESEIIGKQNGLKDVINGPLALAREKRQILESDEAQAVLSRIDLNYHSDLSSNVLRIFEEEVERATVILNEIESDLENLKSILETIIQRIQNEKRKQQLGPDGLSIRSSQYEDARFVFVHLKLRSEIYRQYLEIPFEEKCNKIAQNIDDDIVEGDFLLRLSKLEVSCVSETT